MSGTEDAIVFLGFDPAAVSEISRLSPRVWVVIVEPEAESFRPSPVLERERVRLFVGESLDQLRAGLNRWLVESQADEIRVVSNRTLEAETREVAAALNRRRTDVMTLVANAERATRNWIGNFPWIARSAGVRSFENRFSGIPAVLVAAGPSLDTQLEALKSAVGRALFVCVGKSLGLLLRHGVVPDFVCHLDMSPSSQACFEGVSIPPEVTLVWDPESFTGAVAAFPGDRVTFETGLAGSEWGRAFWGEKGHLARGLSVAHTAFHFARALGADPLILVGVDFALPGERTHAEGVTMTWGGPVEPLLGATIEISAVRGGTVRTLPAFQAFVTHFEEEISRTKARVVNTSAVGALLRGAVSGTVESALGKPVEVRASIAAALVEPRPFQQDLLGAAVQRLLEAAGRIDAAAESGLRPLRRAARLDPRNRIDREEFAKLAERVNRHRAEILCESEIDPFLQRLLAPEAVEIQRIARRIESSDAAGRMKLDVERTELFFRGYRRAVAILRDALTR